MSTCLTLLLLYIFKLSYFSQVTGYYFNVCPEQSLNEMRLDKVISPKLENKGKQYPLCETDEQDILNVSRFLFINRRDFSP